MHPAFKLYQETGMSSSNESRLQEWLALEAAQSGRHGEPGIVPSARLQTSSGLDILQAIGDGGLPLPPIFATLNMFPVEVEPGRIVFQGHPLFAHYNPIGSVHGGWAATLLDSCVACAIHSTLPAGKGYTTLELKVNYVRALTEATGPVRAEGKVIHVGGRTATAEGRITDAHGKLYAHASTTCLILDFPR